MASLMEIKCVNPKLKENQIAKELRYSSSTLQRYRKDINMLSANGIPRNNTNREDKVFKYKPR